MSVFNFDKDINFPSLKRIQNKKLKESIGLSAWSTRIYSEVQNDIQLNKGVEMILCKGCESIKYELIETERDIIIRYKWNDFDEMPDFVNDLKNLYR